MKRFNNVLGLAFEIAKMNGHALDEKQEMVVAINIRNLYAKHGKEGVVDHIGDTLPSHRCLVGFTMEQKYKVSKMVEKMFFWHFLPWSTIRNNMLRLTVDK